MPALAANIDAAIAEFASTGAGVLRKIDVDGQTALRLYIAPFFAWISVTSTEVLV